MDAQAPLMPEAEPRLRIGQVAAQAGVSIQTLRYYERRGLLSPPVRSVLGHREYPPEAVAVVRFAKRAQELGFSLSQVEALLRLRAVQGAERLEAREVAEGLCRDIGLKRQHLEALQSALEAFIASCARPDGRPECRLLEVPWGQGAAGGDKEELLPAAPQGSARK
jgi:DNA-binding transcriptional MerR regulator